MMNIMVKSRMAFARHVECMEGCEICRCVVFRRKIGKSEESTWKIE
jgi:hypothetical protein